MIKSIILVAIGGAFGSVLRYGINYLMKNSSSSFPFATFLVNIIGCLLIGLLVGYFDKLQITNDHMKLLLITGFCGGFTTFSAFAFENIRLLQDGQFFTLAIYISLSILLGLLSVGLGMYLMK